jgi:hypothetical protein
VARLIFERTVWHDSTVRRLGLLLLAACVGNVSSVGDSGGDDSGLPDAAIPDAGGGDSGVPDAGPRDAGTTDSGTPDAGTPDGGSGDGGCAAAFCDDFESYNGAGAPKGPWSVNTNGGAVVMDNSKSHSGTRSVHVSTDGQSSYRQAYMGMTSPFFPRNEFYGRVWMFLNAVPTQTTHWTNISGEGAVADAGSSVRAYVRYGGQYSPNMMANYDTSGAATDCWQHSMFAMPTMRWACYEWHFKQNGNLMELWVDGQDIIAITVNGMGSGCINHDLGDQWLLPVFDTLRLGWEHYQTSDPIDLWIDDVALDGQRIGCN